MEKIDRRKKAIILLYSYLIILLSPKTKAQIKRKEYEISYNEEYNIDNNNLFASINDIKIYICNGYSNNINPNYIYICDMRDDNNPDIEIYNSYKITDLKEITKILEVLLEYEKKNPSNWNRTIKSMKNEWIIHNICYKYNIEQYRTKEVDLDNSEEEKYLYIIKSLIETIKLHMFNEINNNYYKKER